MGLTLLAMARGEEAVRHLEHSVELEPGNAETAFLLGEVLRDLGRAEEATAA